ncbi:MAG: hypothetical protein R2828_24980 [Saprospiraceae bacterium]
MKLSLKPVGVIGGEEVVEVFFWTWNYWTSDTVDIAIEIAIEIEIVIAIENRAI